ncbi:MAG: Ig-like domain-containing protein [Paracoccaceae bacterium]|nr:Ig-like domain-containing protein [Paracoccaceae bacterium]
MTQAEDPAALLEDIASSDEASAARLVVGAYQTFLGRLPEAGGLSFWAGAVADGTGPNDLADAFAAVRRLDGTLTEFGERVAGMSIEDIVGRFYRDALGREADEAGLAHWTAVVEALVSAGEARGLDPEAALGDALSEVGLAFLQAEEAQAIVDAAFPELVVQVAHEGPGALDPGRSLLDLLGTRAEDGPEIEAEPGEPVSGVLGDGEGQAQYSLNEGPRHGELSLGPDGAYTYLPDADHTGEDSFSVTVTLPGGMTESRTVQITVADGNPDAPSPEAALGDRTDADGATVALSLAEAFSGLPAEAEFSAEGLPAGLSVENGTISGSIDGAASQGGPGGDGLYEVVIRGSIGSIAVEESFAWRVTNPAPVAVRDLIGATEDTPISLPLLSNDFDPDGDPLSIYAPIAGATHGTVSLSSSGKAIYRPDPEFSGTDSFSYILVDGDGARDTGRVTVLVGARNDAPIAQGPLADRTNEDGDAVDVVLGDAFTDIDSAALTFTGTGLPRSLSIDPASGRVSGSIASSASTDGGSDDGVYMVGIEARDGSGGRLVREFSWTVLNPEPTAGDTTLQGTEDQETRGDVSALATDPDGDALTYTLAGGPAYGAVDLAPDGSFTYTPAANYNGKDAFTYRVTDADGAEASGTVSLEIAPVNDAPTTDSTGETLTERDGDRVQLNFFDSFSDLDGDKLSYRAEGLPAGLTLGASTAILYGTIDSSASSGGPDGDGVYPARVYAADPDGAEASFALTFEITNTAPVAESDSFSMERGEVFTGDLSLNDTDEDGDDLTYSLDPGLGWPGPFIGGNDVSIAPDGTFTYTSGLAGVYGQDVVGYQVTDADGATDTSYATITISKGSSESPETANDDDLGLLEPERSLIVPTRGTTGDLNDPAPPNQLITGRDIVREYRVPLETLGANDEGDPGDIPERGRLIEDFSFVAGGASAFLDGFGRRRIEGDDLILQVDVEGLLGQPDETIEIFGGQFGYVNLPDLEASYTADDLEPRQPGVEYRAPVLSIIPDPSLGAIRFEAAAVELLDSRDATFPSSLDGEDGGDGVAGFKVAEEVAPVDIDFGTDDPVVEGYYGKIVEFGATVGRDLYKAIVNFVPEELTELAVGAPGSRGGPDPYVFADSPDSPDADNLVLAADGPAGGRGGNGGDGADGIDGVFVNTNTYADLFASGTRARDGEEGPPGGRGGGGANATYVVRSGLGNDVILGGDAGDGGDGGNAGQWGEPGIESVLEGQFGSSLTADGGTAGVGADGGDAGSAAYRIVAGEGDDLVIGGDAGNGGDAGETISGFFEGTLQTATALGGTGGSSSYVIEGGDGNDHIVSGTVGQLGADKPGLGTVSLPGGDSSYEIYGGNGNDRIELAPNPGSLGTYHDAVKTLVFPQNAGSGAAPTGRGAYVVDAGPDDDTIVMTDHLYPGFSIEGGSGFDELVFAFPIFDSIIPGVIVDGIMPGARLDLTAPAYAHGRRPAEMFDGIEMISLQTEGPVVFNLKLDEDVVRDIASSRKLYITEDQQRVPRNVEIADGDEWELTAEGISGPKGLSYNVYAKPEEDLEIVIADSLDVSLIGGGSQDPA